MWVVITSVIYCRMGPRFDYDGLESGMARLISLRE
jgi:hypothetical protein